MGGDPGASFTTDAGCSPFEGESAGARSEGKTEKGKPKGKDKGKDGKGKDAKAKTSGASALEPKEDQSGPR